MNVGTHSVSFFDFDQSQNRVKIHDRKDLSRFINLSEINKTMVTNGTDDSNSQLKQDKLPN